MRAGRRWKEKTKGDCCVWAGRELKKRSRVGRYEKERRILSVGLEDCCLWVKELERWPEDTLVLDRWCGEDTWIEGGGGVEEEVPRGWAWGGGRKGRRMWTVVFGEEWSWG